MLLLKSTLAQQVKWRRIRGYLNDQLHGKEQVGEVVSIVTANRNRKRICCYGQIIRDERLFIQLNLQIGTVIAYPHRHQATSWKKGYFVRLNELEPRNEDRWVALINIAIASVSLETVILFP